MLSLPAEADGQFGVFTTVQAAACGWTPKALAKATSKGELVRIRRAVYAAATHCVDPHPSARRTVLQGAVAATLAGGSATVSHSSAAIAHDLPVMMTPDVPCVSVDRNHTAIDGVHLHRRASSPSHRKPVGLVPVTDPARTCVDIAREAGLLPGLVTTDAALHRGLVTAADLEAEYATLRGRAGLRDGRRLLELCSPLSESPLETISLFHMSGLPVQPRQQAELYTSLGEFIGRADFYWEQFGLVGEADGREKYDGDELYREKLRQDAMLSAGLLVIRWGWATAMSRRRLDELIRAELARAEQLRLGGFLTRAIAA
jgi:predicted transcriptional regulator of viral defense system